MAYHALLDSKTLIVLTIEKEMAPILFLVERIPSTTYAVFVDIPNYQTSLFGLRGSFLGRLPRSLYPHLTWNKSTRRFTNTKYTLITPELRKMSRHMYQKAGVYSLITKRLSTVNNILSTGMSLQERVYSRKREQAQLFKETEGAMHKPSDFFYLQQYADIANISLPEAADDILFKAKLEDEKLSLSEFLRLKFTRQLAAAKDEREIFAVRDRFISALYHE